MNRPPKQRQLDIKAPFSLERRYQTELNKLIKEIGQVMDVEIIPHLAAILNTRADEERFDDLASRIAALFLIARGRISGLIAAYGFQRVIQNLSLIINEFNAKQFNKSVKYKIGEYPLSVNPRLANSGLNPIGGNARMTKAAFNQFIKTATPEQIMSVVNKGQAPFGSGSPLPGNTTTEQKLKVNNILKSSLGIDPLAGNPKLTEQLNLWVIDNVNLVKGASEVFVNQAEQIVMSGARTGVRHEQMAKQIMEGTELEKGRFLQLKTRAALIARDQTNKLNGSLNRLRQTESGIEDYTWRDVGDARVRHEHRILDGKVFSWETGAPSLGGLNPGDDYNCRCWADPVIDLNKLLGED